MIFSKSFMEDRTPKGKNNDLGKLLMPVNMYCSMHRYSLIQSRFFTGCVEQATGSGIHESIGPAAGVTVLGVAYDDHQGILPKRL